MFYKTIIQFWETYLPTPKLDMLVKRVKDEKLQMALHLKGLGSSHLLYHLWHHTTKYIYITVVLVWLLTIKWYEMNVWSFWKDTNLHVYTIYIVFCIYNVQIMNMQVQQSMNCFFRKHNQGPFFDCLFNRNWKFLHLEIANSTSFRAILFFFKRYCFTLPRTVDIYSFANSWILHQMILASNFYVFLPFWNQK